MNQGEERREHHHEYKRNSWGVIYGVSRCTVCQKVARPTRVDDEQAKWVYAGGQWLAGFAGTFVRKEP